MAPPRNPNPAFPKFGFEPFYVTVTEPGTGKPHTYTDYRPKPGTGYDILTDDVLNSGNLKVLNDFYNAHEKELRDPKNAPAKEYLDARIETAKRFQDRERKAKLDAANRKTPPKLEVDNVDGIVGFSNLKYPDYQTSSNGCWSISYSTLLRSRGVDISQEEIRRWRPDYPENIEPEKKANPERKLTMNSDTGNAIFPNGDLLGKVLPNTAVNQLHIEPFETEQLTMNGTPLNAKQQQIVKDEYKAQVKTQLQKTIMDAIQIHRSPVAIAWDGHFVTITGISADGQTLRYEESLGAERNAQRTCTMPLDELINQGLEAHDHNGTHFAYGTGLELNWLSDLPVAEYGSGAPQPPLDGIGYAKVNEDGSVSVEVPLDAKGVSRSGRPHEGQLNGAAVEQLVNLDQTKLSEKLGGKVSGWGSDGGVMLGAMSAYYPDRVMRPGDPQLQKSAFEGLEEDIEEVSSCISYIRRDNETDENRQLLQDAKDALKVLEDAAEGKPVDLGKNPEKLAKLIDYLAEKPKGSNKTNFENIFYYMNGSSRKKVVDGLSAVDLALGLGKSQKVELLEDLHVEMEAGYKRQYASGVQDALAKRKFNNQIEESWKLAKECMTGSANNADVKNLRDEALARIIASYALYASNNDAGRKPPYPTEAEIQNMIPVIKTEQAFEEITTGMQQWMVDPNFGPTNFIQRYAKIQRKIQSEKIATERYKISEERLPVVQDAASKIADRLDATKTGSYDGAGVVSRFGNSGKFEDAKTAIRNFSQKKNPSAKNVKTAADTVMRYLSGKETVRKRPFGRARWHDCMTFLSHVMPRDQFENYCREVNDKRHVAPGHPDFVGPETFYADGTTITDVEVATKERIVLGDYTYRDFARLLACDRMREDHDVLGEVPKCSTPEEKSRLCGATEEVLGDPRFADFIGDMTQEERVAMSLEKPEVLRSAWDTYKEAHPVRTGEEILKNSKSVSVPQI